MLPDNAGMHDTSSTAPGLEPGWRWNNSFAALGPDFYTPMRLQSLAGEDRLANVAQVNRWLMP